MSKYKFTESVHRILPYPSILTICYTNNISKAYPEHYEQAYGEAEGIDDCTSAFVTHDEAGCVLVVFGPNVTHEIIAHEALHIMHKMMGFTGMEFDHDIDASNEHLTYLIGYLVKLIYTHLIDNRCRITND